MIVDLVALVVGLAVLTVAADQFVAGAVGLAVRMNVSTVVIGALVIGFGTSAPELVVSTIAAFDGQVDLGVGNVVGSNAANLTLVLGATALVHPVVIGDGLLRQGVLSCSAVICFALLVQNDVTRVEGVVLAVALVAALYMVVRMGGHLAEEEPSGGLGPKGAWIPIIGGFVGTFGGAWVVVEAAKDIADEMGWSGGFVGFTMVAVGTSLPELVTAGAAARRKETGLIIGNLMGSNLFNSLAVGAALFLAGPGVVTDVRLQTWGVILMVTVSVAVLVVMATYRSVAMTEGVVLLGAYAGVILFMARGLGAA